MKKVINITIGGVVFAIEESAYVVLSKYLEDVKVNLSASADYAEIAEDIEAAIAEKFIARKCSEKRAVTDADVSFVTKEMGDPVDFSDQSAQVGEESVETEEEVQETEESEHIRKRLYRDTEDEVLAGVASGIAKYFDVDPVIIRLAFVIGIFINGLGVLAYLILWLVVPPAETTAQRYAMRGEKVTIKEITEQVKKSLHNLEEADYTRAKGTWGKIRLALNKFFEALGLAVRALVASLRYLVGIVFILAGALGIAGLVSVYSIAIFSENMFSPDEVQAGLEILMSSPLGIVLLVAVFVVAIVTLLALIVLGESIFENKNRFSVGKAVTLTVLWITAVAFAGTMSVLQVEQVVKELEAQGYDHGGHEIYINTFPFQIEVMDIEDISKKPETVSPEEEQKYTDLIQSNKEAAEEVRDEINNP